MNLGAIYLGEGKCQFNVWAPYCEKVDVHILQPNDQLISLEKDAQGYHHATLDNIWPGSQYLYRLDGQNEFPDPVSRSQPEGVHGPSQVIKSDFAWQDNHWDGIPLEEYIIYELHVGTYTSEGTFHSIIPHLDKLIELGITAIELMPVAQFSGKRNWGYDGVYPFAVQNSYGGPEALKELVNTCHRKGLAVILDVVYNHLGPEGNYLAKYAPYFTERYNTPWGWALNFDGPDSDEVRRYFIENALYWITEFHIDGLRLDAVHAILDHSPVTFLEDLATEVHKKAAELNRYVYLFPESADNEKRLITSPELGGYGLDAQWNDDFHHAIHVLFTGEKTGYYQDYGEFKHLVKAFQEGFVYTNEYSPYRKRRHGSSSLNIPAYRFVVCSQNHDQVGNRMLGERSSQLVSFEELKLIAGLVILSPFIPLLFMGEEYGETAPFLYFTHHSDQQLVKAVRKGRKEEFASFKWAGEPPDPQAEATFAKSKINHHLYTEGQHRILYQFYRVLIRIRKATPSLSNLSKDHMKVIGDKSNGIMQLHRWTDNEQVAIICNLSKKSETIDISLPGGDWNKLIDSTDQMWNGTGSKLPEVLTTANTATLTIAQSSVAVYYTNARST